MGKKFHLKQQLHSLLYDPTLPETWEVTDSAQQLTIAYGLFLLLNSKFQKRYGELIEIEVFMRPFDEELQEGIITWKKYRAKVPAAIEKRQTELHKKFHVWSDEPGKQWPFDVDLYLLISLLMKRPLRIGPQNGKILFMDNEADECKRSIERWSKSRYKDIPEELYYQFNIAVDKEALLRRFEAVIDEFQESFFKRFPEKRSLVYGHLPRKKETVKRAQPYNWETMKKCYQAHVYDVMGKKNREIADLLYGNDNGGIRRIEKHLLRAKQLIDAAWNNKFPGPYKD